MIIISHRGLLDGCDEQLENNPEQIQKAINLGFDVEIDVWKKDNFLFLGHDEAQYNLPAHFLYGPILDRLWIHCKNIEAFHFFDDIKGYYGEPSPQSNYFWHQTDDVVLTSQGFLWVYPGKKLNHNSICVLPEASFLGDESWRQAAGVCTDYPIRYKELL